MSTATRGRLKRCLCELGVEELIPWARRRFGGGATTLQLIREAADEHSKECVACVALLDLPEEALRAAAEGDEALAERLVSRRRELLRQLSELGVEVPAG